MINIPIFDASAEVVSIHEEVLESIKDVLFSGQFILGPNVNKLEQELAAYLGVKYAYGVNSGTDALVIGLRAAGIGSGDKVITTPFTFFATSEAIHQVGAEPIFVDIDPKTFNMDVNKLEEVITPDTKAILPVHLFGQACDMDPLLVLAQKHNLKIIEDVAQGFGGEYKGKKLGSIGDVGCFSFFPTKNLGAYGDGGLITTNDEETARLIRMLRAHGSEKKYHNEMFGYNSRLDELHASILRVKLPKVDDWNQKRRDIAARYHTEFAGINGISLPSEQDGTSHVFHQYTIRVLEGKRDSLKQYLADKGIGSMVYYPVPLHKLPVYQGSNWTFEFAEKAAEEVLSLPMWPLMPEKVQAEVVKAIQEYFV
ncbi:DegT/DnrJ/EryC1/StrS family aminotransferase [Paenibacillus allorhizosphaerae]|uniref:dTDP-3-amino-3,6-dideoxy-alpha-D-galactopyranose transaminase n=1 Tax=Paenibacillus allorhizosphaerae TaxID=2849866 RepID=A0ABM8VS46_9BACL|nr:DegT/DnrJ/EryC1/StrS family aminotransferase [Paenibacillus allorhizosphaerae]CAG7656166.1 dTDP-3-amino-3,6-dideoxy-alpha-D-galactopyranose transaminase [Paenibacillus allorhizosphaerae]